MSYLLRVELPDVPGSLGRLATAIGDAGGNIAAIEIIDRTPGAHAVDDVFLSADGVMPDTIVSACNQLEDVEVLWISRYGAGGNLFMDLEAVESMTEAPGESLERLVEALPEVFRVDWGIHVRRAGDHRIEVVQGTSAAPGTIPEDLSWPGRLERGERIDVPDKWEGLVVAGTAIDADSAIVVGRRGGPEFLDSEIARLGHLVALASSIARNA
ncbi:MAG TPA: ACT domain-containing protein [Marmoricola sp.]|jgi:hypothetical protein|nr:ACT domain-containing protein [Marmoricola sp.]